MNKHVAFGLFFSSIFVIKGLTIPYYDNYTCIPSNLLFKGKTIKEVHEVEPGYYSWFISPNTDFPLYTKQKLREEMDKIKNQNKEEKVSSEDLNSQLEALKSKFSK
jgi:hypothetical protein